MTGFLHLDRSDVKGLHQCCSGVFDLEIRVQLVISLKPEANRQNLKQEVWNNSSNKK